MEKEEKIRKICEELFESEVMRCLVGLELLEKHEFLTKRARSLASMGLAEMVKKGIPFPWERGWK